MKSDVNKCALIQYLCDVNKMNPQMQLIRDECIFLKRLTWKSSATFWSCHNKRITFKLSLKHGHYCSTGVLLGLQACCTSFHKKYDGKVDINPTALKAGNKSFDLLAVHALSGCDIMSYPFESESFPLLTCCSDWILIYKYLQSLMQKKWTGWKLEWTLSYLYCEKLMESLNNLRFTLFSKKQDPPKIRSLPPNDKAAIEHVKRARLQVLLWRAAD